MSHKKIIAGVALAAGAAASLAIPGVGAAVVAGARVAGPFVAKKLGEFAGKAGTKEFQGAVGKKLRSHVATAAVHGTAATAARKLSKNKVDDVAKTT